MAATLAAIGSAIAGGAGAIGGGLAVGAGALGTGLAAGAGALSAAAPTILTGLGAAGGALATGLGGLGSVLGQAGPTLGAFGTQKLLGQVFGGGAQGGSGLGSILNFGGGGAQAAAQAVPTFAANSVMQQAAPAQNAIPDLLGGLRPEGTPAPFDVETPLRGGGSQPKSAPASIFSGLDAKDTIKRIGDIVNSQAFQTALATVGAVQKFNAESTLKRQLAQQQALAGSTPTGPIFQPAQNQALTGLGSLFGAR